MKEPTSEEATPKNLKSRRPRDTKFHQQKLHGWNPDFGAKNIGFLFIISGILFVLIFIFVLILQSGIVTFTLDYTNCKSPNGYLCSQITGNKSLHLSNCTCKIIFRNSDLIKAPVYFYYQLNNYYQNHRRFLNSRDDLQLNGRILNLSSDCDPIRYADSLKRIKYAPCGLVANALFNDTFQLLLRYKNHSVIVPWSRRGIAWNLDKNHKFGRPPNWVNTVKPPNWNVAAVDRNSKAYSGDEEFLVWMRPSALPTVTKLHRILHSNFSPFDSGLPKGNYTFLINYVYPVSRFHGQKSIFISTAGLFGGKNDWMSYLPLLVGTVHFTLGIILILLERYSVNTVGAESLILEVKYDGSKIL